MEPIRKPLQGISNIIRFNWHFYAIATGLIIALFFSMDQIEKPYQTIVLFLCILVTVSTTISLLASLYIYDLSGLYSFDWIHQNNNKGLTVNINAGFDETSYLLQAKFKNTELIVLDFYDPTKHTEVSIKRARKAYPSYPKTKQVGTTDLQLPDNSVDNLFLILSAHEIRNKIERVAFFKELRRVIKPSGTIYVTEHLRDLPNFLVYNVGFFHFYSKNDWRNTFNEAALNLKQEIKNTVFISTFKLNKSGNTF